MDSTNSALLYETERGVDAVDDVQRVLLSEEEIARKVKQLGAAITEDYQGKDLVLVGILKGAIIFLADLMREIKTPVNVDFMAVSSYAEGTTSSGVVRILKDLDLSIENRHILIVEDIVDTGLTLEYLVDILRSRHPASIGVAALLDKPDRRLVDIIPDYLGFSIPDEFVVGYGLDFAEQYRSLPYVGILKPDAYQDA